MADYKCDDVLAFRQVCNPREFACMALLKAMQGEMFLVDSFAKWHQSAAPSSRDYRFAYEIACGSMRMKLALDFAAKRLSDKQRLSLKPKERTLLHTALYQHFFMDRVPQYAIVNETIQLAKKWCHSSFVSFLNAVLRKLPAEKNNFSPAGNSLSELSIRYSYPEHFIQELIKEYGLGSTQEILAAGNTPSPTMVRLRLGAKVEPYLKLVRPDTAILEDPTFLSTVAASPDYYIQNATPVLLIDALSSGLNPPKRVLDLCAAPGGKLLAVHDKFPKAWLFANDVSRERLQLLLENVKKYGLAVAVSCEKGEALASNEPFDLIILDVPCSNSGVLNKRPEARWRLSIETLKELEDMQLKLIQHAAGLLADGGEIWYITCSILNKENQQLVAQACGKFNLKVRTENIILPNQQGIDGGYASALISC